MDQSRSTKNANRRAPANKGKRLSRRTAKGRSARLCVSCQKSFARRDGLCASCFNRRLRDDIQARERAQPEIAEADPQAARKAKRAVTLAEKKFSTQITQRAEKLQALQLKRGRLVREWHKRHRRSTYQEVAAPVGPIADRLRRLDQQIRDFSPQRKNRGGGGRPRNPKVDQLIEQATKLREQGLSLDRAAEQLQVDPRGLRRALNRRKLPKLLAEWVTKMDQEWPPRQHRKSRRDRS
jgi:hypothetical protein